MAMIVSQQAGGAERVVSRYAGRASLFVAALAVSLGSLRADPAPYPFEGTWVRSDRLCTAGSPHIRTYTNKELSTPAGRCQLRKVVFGSGEFELFEECRRTDHSGNVIEKIRLLGADTIVVKQQVRRLKIPRGRRFTRCAIAAPPLAPPAKPLGKFTGPTPPKP